MLELYATGGLKENVDGRASAGQLDVAAYLAQPAIQEVSLLTTALLQQLNMPDDSDLKHSIALSATACLERNAGSICTSCLCWYKACMNDHEQGSMCAQCSP